MSLFVHNDQALLLYSNGCLLGCLSVSFFSSDSLALLNQGLKEQFITSTIAHYSSQ